MRRTTKKRIIIWSAVLFILLVLAIIGTKIIQGVLEKHHISYTSLIFHFPSSIEVEGLIVEPNEGFRIQINRLEAGWSWGSLIRRKPAITHLLAGSGTLYLVSEPDSASGKEIELPELSVRNVHLENLALELRSGKDSLNLKLGELRLNDAAIGEQVRVDSFFLQGTSLFYSSGESSNQESDSLTSFTLGSIPEFEINQLSLSRCKLELRNQDNIQQVDQLEIALRGWKSSDLLNVNVERFGFVYQDTLEVDLVLENGEINQDFKAEIRDFGAEIPGVSLNVALATADLKEGIHASMTLSDSYLTMARIRQVYPGIDSILHPELPGSTRFRLEGDLELTDRRLAINSLLIRALDSTSMLLSGTADLSEDPKFDLGIQPFRSTRSNLLLLLAEADYHRFYLWPRDIDGVVRAGGTLDDIGIYGDLNTREGILLAESHIKTDSLTGLDFTLDIRSDSLWVNEITDLLPLDVPHGQLHFFLRLLDAGEEGSAPLWINITSDHLFTFDRYIHDIVFGYYGDSQLDSMHAELNDTTVKLMMDLVTPGNGDGTTQFTGNVDHIIPGAFSPALPDSAIAFHLNGDYLFGDDEALVHLELASLALTGNEQVITIPDSRFSLSMKGDRVFLEAESEGEAFLTARTGTRFPEFGLPLPGWLKSWPDTELDFRMNLDESLVTFFTGTTGYVNLEEFMLRKDSMRWEAQLELPEINYSGILLEEFAVDIRSSDGELNGLISIDSLSNKSLQVGGITSHLGYQDHHYWLGLENTTSELLGSNQLAMRVEELDSSYYIRFNDTVPLVINSEPWQIGVNNGLELDQRFKILQGDLGIMHEPAQLEVVTDGRQINLFIDSLQLEPLLSYLTDGELVRGQLNAEAKLSLPEMETTWEAEILAYNDLVPDPAVLDVKGSRSGSKMEASLDFSHQDASASALLQKQSGPLNFSFRLDRFDLEALRYIPNLPPELEMSGLISGQASGTLGEIPSVEGILIAENLYLVPPVSGSPIRVEHDTLFLQNNELKLHNFRIRDSHDQVLTLEGIIRYNPELKGKIQLKSEQFALLKQQKEDAQIQGDLSARADLTMEGDMDQLVISGTLNTLPGASVKYISEKSFDMVDASQILTFMELDGEDSLPAPSPIDPGMDITWDVDLDVDDATFEIMLDEISQQYIRITSEGKLNLRSGSNSQPMIFGAITSKTGHAFIKPPAIPDLDLIIENATIQWMGPLEEPTINFRAYKIVKGVTSGLSPELENNTQLVDYRVYVILENATLSEFNLNFDLSVEDSQAQLLLSSLPADTRQAYALNLLVFGKIGNEEIKGNDMLAKQVTRKLNELSRRNFKNTGLLFSSASYTDRSDRIHERDRTDLSYNLSRGFLNNRLNVSVGGSVGFYMDDMTMLPPSNLIGDLELSYILNEKPTLILKGARKNVYEGIIDGMVTEESLGLTFQKSYRTFPLLMLGGQSKKKEGEE